MKEWRLLSLLGIIHAVASYTLTTPPVELREAGGSGGRRSASGFQRPATNLDRRKYIAVGLTLLALLTFPKEASGLDMLGAWRCSGRSNAELVDNLFRGKLIKTQRVKDAMDQTDRAIYVGAAGGSPYDDCPQPIGWSATISAPHMHASAAEDLSLTIPHRNARVLDVGSGSGYLTAVFARMAGPTGKIVGIDYLDPLTRLGEENVRRDDAELLTSGRVAFETRDGWKGYAEMAPYDAIHVGAAAEKIPLDLVSQLKVGGRMIVPVGPEGGHQELMLIDRIKDEGPVEKSYSAIPRLGVIYVPLVKVS
jgi:protein-L-isoaspartate(D-aspartate) O-methyltransferase